MHRRYIIQRKRDMCHTSLPLLLLTTFDGDPVGAFDGLIDDERDGAFDGAFEGDWLGVVVGCGMITEGRKLVGTVQCTVSFFIGIGITPRHWHYSTHTRSQHSTRYMYKATLTTLDGDSVGAFEGD